MQPMAWGLMQHMAWWQAYYHFWLSGRAWLGFLGCCGGSECELSVQVWVESFHCMDIILIEFYIQRKSQEILEVVSKCLTNIGKLLFVRSMSVDMRDWITQLDIPIWVCNTAIPCSWEYNLVNMHNIIVALSCFMFPTWTATWHSVTADWLPITFMYWVMFFTLEV